MGVFEHFPYVNYHELNLSWILRKIKELEDVIGSQIVDIVARAGVAENAQAIADLTDTVDDNATTAHNESQAALEAAQAASSAAQTADGKAVTAQNGVTSINTFLAKTATTPTYEANITADRMSIIKTGHIVTMSFSVTNSSPWVTGWNNLFTISDTAYQPTAVYEFDGVDNVNDTAVHMQITNTGVLRLYKPANVSIGAGIRGSETFLN